MKIKKEIITVIAFVIFGFFCASFLFRFLTSHARVDTAGVAVPSFGEKITPSSSVSALSPKQPESESKAALETARVQPDKSAKTQAAPAIKRRVAVEEKSEEVVFPPLRVNGIFSSKEGNVALINDVVMKEGDVILGVKVLRIHANAVEMEMKGQTKTVRIK